MQGMAQALRQGGPMHRSTLIRSIALALLAVTSVSAAHHSQSMFVETPVWVTGVIVKYRPVDPHVMIELQEPQPDGKGKKWIIEGPRMGRLEWILQNNGGIQADRILKVGDRITVCGFPLKKDWDPGRMYADWPPEQGRFVHGQVFVMPDGRMQSWGPYGVIDNCMRKTDTAKTWITFLNRDPLAHEQWCVAMTYTQMAHHSPRAAVEDVNRGLDEGCR
jgi:predicted aconitase with swiveling domain